MRKLTISAVMVTAFCLAGCSTTVGVAGATPEPNESAKQLSSSSPQPTVTTDVGPTFATAAELRDAAVRAGAVCDSWVPKKTLAGEVDGGVCDGHIGISIMNDVQSRNHVLALNAESAEGQPFLIGSNWLYTDQGESGDPIASMRSLAAPLGGVFWQPSDPIPST